VAISKNQIAVIHIAKNKLHMADEDYRALLFRIAGVRSSTDLEEPGFEALMVAFQDLGYRPARSRTEAARREGMASPTQIGKILSLWKSYSGNDDELRMGRWLEKHFHVSHVRFLEAGRAGKAIAVLTKMAAYRTKKKISGESSPVTPNVTG
jgi:hypothetical protein